mmetsp:Transcript_16498/g.53793  ORF Transcript_16498/g.53793 Transcript_16498/m.53793 type:complete len:237 (-) Transcript_16498:2729-3439(-)
MSPLSVSCHTCSWITSSSVSGSRMSSSSQWRTLGQRIARVVCSRTTVHIGPDRSFTLTLSSAVRRRGGSSLFRSESGRLSALAGWCAAGDWRGVAGGVGISVAPAAEPCSLAALVDAPVTLPCDTSADATPPVPAVTAMPAPPEPHASPAAPASVPAAGKPTRASPLTSSSGTSSAPARASDGTRLPGAKPAAAVGSLGELTTATPWKLPPHEASASRLPELPAVTRGLADGTRDG